MLFGEIFLRILVLFFTYGFIRSKKKVGINFHPSLLCTVGSGVRIRDEFFPDPEGTGTVCFFGEIFLRILVVLFFTNKTCS
jgi:hypothetical protein